MKIDLLKEIKKRTMLSNIILGGIESSILKEIVQGLKRSDNGKYNIKITINGVEVNLRRFIKNWQSSVDNRIAEAAKDVIQEKLSGVSNLLYDLEQRLNTEIECRLEEWEREIKVTKDLK